ncbi:MAG: acyclic terpene utilization AtuA family protein [Thermodesulfobacteriota bacterium]|nr:acyclic terpene utilization AtuA family protein [Thermodesulfobacteriota bacterium]
MDEKLIVANCSGFYGDRFSAAREMVEGGPIDVLTGDYLAELTMAILFRKTLKNPEAGYATSFFHQMKEVMAPCLSRGIKVVTNAGGLSPRGLADALAELAGGLGLSPKIAWIEGDNLFMDLETLQEKGESLRHLETGASPDDDPSPTMVTANAYLGGWGITRALVEGADIVVGGRIADAALVSGPAAWRFGWKETDWDKLAGAVAAGHIIECGAQATGGNYPFMDEVGDYHHIGFPIAEIYPDGSSVITKHPGTGGSVSVGTVTAQLMYEIKGPEYLTPDVIARFDTISLSQEDADRVRVTGIRGQAPTDTLKVCCNRVDGHRNIIRFVLTGLDVDKKAEIVESTFFGVLGGKNQFDEVDVRLHGRALDDPQRLEDAHTIFEIAVRGQNAALISKRFPQVAIELALASIPGFTLAELPGKGNPVIQHWPTLVSKLHVQTVVRMDDGRSIPIDWPDVSEAFPQTGVPVTDQTEPVYSGDNTVFASLGTIMGARSGDKGGDANVGVWVKQAAAYEFLNHFLTVDQFRELLPDTASYAIERYDFPNLLAVNFYIHGILGDGVASSLQSDPQAKSLGEYLRCKKVEIPAALLTE